MLKKGSVVMRSLSRDGAHDGRPWSPGSRETPLGLDERSQRVAKERAAQRARSWTVPNKMRAVFPTNAK